LRGISGLNRLSPGSFPRSQSQARPRLYLIQILVPLFDNDGARLGLDTLRAIRAELVERFGGLTAFTRAPAEGLWTDADRVSHDDIVIFEVMTGELDEAWWHGYRRELETRLRQKLMVIRAQPISLL
jgi:hypothetical protein